MATNENMIVSISPIPSGVQKQLHAWITSGDYGQKKDYGATSNNTIPIVKALMTPMTMALDGMSADRITADTTEIAAVAAIRIAGAITHGISCVNHSRVCTSPPFHPSSGEMSLDHPSY